MRSRICRPFATWRSRQRRSNHAGQSAMLRPDSLDECVDRHLLTLDHQENMRAKPASLLSLIILAVFRIEENIRRERLG